MKKPLKQKPLHLTDRHGNKVYPPGLYYPFCSTEWHIDCGIYQEPNGRWFRKNVDCPPVLLTSIWDQ